MSRGQLLNTNIKATHLRGLYVFPVGARGIHETGQITQRKRTDHDYHSRRWLPGLSGGILECPPKENTKLRNTSTAFSPNCCIHRLNPQPIAVIGLDLLSGGNAAKAEVDTSSEAICFALTAHAAAA